MAPDAMTSAALTASAWNPALATIVLSAILEEPPSQSSPIPRKCGLGKALQPSGVADAAAQIG
jgi:hypothetical protein